jgi:predicted dinucleotide-binding enzyme
MGASMSSGAAHKEKLMKCFHEIMVEDVKNNKSKYKTMSAAKLEEHYRKLLTEKCLSATGSHALDAVMKHNIDIMACPYAQIVKMACAPADTAKCTKKAMDVCRR